jgi:hypothetical protein
MAQVQASDVDFALHTLGWKAFQDLCATIATEVFGQTFQVFHSSNDAGRDGAFQGTWRPSGNITLEGTFVVQCKFSSKPGTSVAFSDLSDEFSKARKLASQGLCTNYILFTNRSLSSAAEIEVRKHFLSIPQIKTFLAFGKEWITLQIRNSRKLRMLVPRIYGLGDLSQIIDERAYAQARAILESMGDDLSKFVLTDAYTRSARAVLGHGFVLLLGEPASGKSTIAASLALGAADNWNCGTFKIQTAEEFRKHWNPSDPHQFFWVDDAFGPNQYKESLVDEWNISLSHLKGAIKQGARVLFTSRDYVYKAALPNLKVSAFPLLQESQVVINVHQLSLAEKNQMLYNHLKLGAQPRTFKSAIKPFLSQVAAHPTFIPEIAKRLGDPIFTSKLPMTREAIMAFVEKPIDLLIEVVSGLDEQSKAAIALIFMSGGSHPSPLEMTDEQEQAVSLLGGSKAGVRKALENLNESLVKRVVSLSGVASWTYRHPTVGDAFAELVSKSSELLDVYLAGTPIEKLITEVVCGAVSVAGAKVSVPSSRFHRIFPLLSNLPQRERQVFLARRCDAGFLRAYMGRPEWRWDELEDFSYVFGSSQISLAARLQEFGLLPPEKKSALFERVVAVSADGPSADFLHPSRMSGLFSGVEVDQMFEAVIERLLPQAEDLVQNWDENYDGSEEPDDYFSSLISALEMLYERSQDPRVDAALNSAIDAASMALESAKENYNYPEPERDYFDFVESSAARNVSSERSVFDDVDE